MSLGEQFNASPSLLEQWDAKNKSYVAFNDSFGNQLIHPPIKEPFHFNNFFLKIGRSITQIHQWSH